MSSKYSDRVKELSNDDLAEALATCNREAKRRLAEKLSPSHMSTWQFNQWASDQIKKAEAAKSKSEAKETD